MRKKATLTLSGLILALLAILFGPGVLEQSGDPSASSGAPRAEAAEAPAAQTSSEPSSKSEPSAKSAASVDTHVGFTSKRALEEHYAKHAPEFGTISQSQYLRLAQELRDAPKGGSVREARRADGVITRFDTRSGAFIAFHQDKSIRTFFKPNDGIRYFERQLEKVH